MQYYVFSTHLFFADCLLKIFELHFFGKIHEAFKLYEILNFLFEKKLRSLLTCIKVLPFELTINFTRENE